MKTISLFISILILVSIGIFGWLVGRNYLRVYRAHDKRTRKGWSSLSFEIFDRIIFIDKEWRKRDYNLIGKRINLDIINQAPGQNRGAYSASIDSISEEHGRLILDTNSSFTLENGTIQAHLLLEAQLYGNDPGSYTITYSLNERGNITGGTGAYEALSGSVSLTGIVKETQSNRLTIKCEVNIKPDGED